MVKENTETREQRSPLVPLVVAVATVSLLLLMYVLSIGPVCHFLSEYALRPGVDPQRTMQTVDIVYAPLIAVVSLTGTMDLLNDYIRFCHELLK